MKTFVLVMTLVLNFALASAFAAGTASLVRNEARNTCGESYCLVALGHELEASRLPEDLGHFSLHDLKLEILRIEGVVNRSDFTPATLDSVLVCAALSDFSKLAADVFEQLSPIIGRLRDMPGLTADREIVRLALLSRAENSRDWMQRGVNHLERSCKAEHSY